MMKLRIPLGKPSRQLKPYMIVCSILVVFAVIVLLVTAVQAGRTKSDRETESKANNIANRLNDYANYKKALPKDLTDVGIANGSNDEDTISYTRLSDEKYRFCVTYKSSNETSVSYNVLGYIYNFWYGSYDGDIGYFEGGEQESLYIPSEHSKGKNCQTVKPYGLKEDVTASAPVPAIAVETDAKQMAIASGAQQNACTFSGYQNHQAAIVTSIGTSDGKPRVPTTGQAIVLGFKPIGSESLPQLEVTMDRNSNLFNVFNRDCMSLSYDSIRVGDYISIFTNNDDRYMINAMVDFSYGQ